MALKSAVWFPFCLKPLFPFVMQSGCEKTWPTTYVGGGSLLYLFAILTVYTTAVTSPHKNLRCTSIAKQEFLEFNSCYSE